MSASTEVTIWCDGIMDDGHQCANWQSNNTVPAPPTYRDLRTALKGSGWVHVGRKDFCAPCVNEGRA